MPRNEDGEFELVVGNKQLLSIIFILMVLFGVVFSMGYFVGRANSGGDEVPVAQQAGSQGRPAPVGAPSPATPPAGDASLQPGEAKVTTPETTSPSSTTPVTPEAGTPAPPAATPTPAPTPAKTPQRAAAPGEPRPGQTFLQVAAVGKPQAEMLVEVLKEKGFPALIAPVGTDGQRYRTLVGPLKDASDLASTKVRLESAGFKPIVKKY